MTTTTPSQGSIPWTLALRDAPRWSPSVVGHKALNLGRLLNAGFAVPPGFCLTTVAFKHALELADPNGRLLHRLHHLDPKDSSSLALAASELRQALHALPLPEAVLAIRDAMRVLNTNGPLAVRSSATAEDLPTASFAGQFESFLQIRGEAAVTEAIRGCYASVFSEHAITYQRHHQLSHPALAMAVVIQQMVPAEVSGVAFSADPLTGDRRRILIEGIPGLGDRLVSGRANPDRVVLEKSSLAILDQQTQSPGDLAQTLHIGVPQPGPGATEPIRLRTSCLTESLVQRVGEMTREVEARFGTPQDIEWAASADQVFLLQTRPITTLAPPINNSSAESDADIWTTGNAIETFPDVLTPMSWSLLNYVAREFLNPMLRQLTGKPDQRSLVGRIAGRAYINLRAITDVFGTLAMRGSADFTTVFGGYQSSIPGLLTSLSTAGPNRPSPRQAMRMVRFGIGLLPFLPRQRQHLMAWGREADAAMVRARPEGLNDADLGKAASSLLKLATHGQGRPTIAAAAWMAVFAVGGFAALFQFTRSWLDDTDGSLANQLLSRSGGMDSAEPAMDLWRLASWTRQHPQLVHALEATGSFSELHSSLEKVELGPDFLSRWQAFMHQHGHQARAGMDISNPRWSEMPDYILGLLKVNLSFPSSINPERSQAECSRQRALTLAECRRRLRNPLKLALLKLATGAAQRGIVQRENIKQAGVRLAALIRQIALEAGRRLTARGLLVAPDDIFFFELSELPLVLRTPPALDLQAIIAARRADYDLCQTLTPPPVVIGAWPPVDQSAPDQSAVPQPTTRSAETLPQGHTTQTPNGTLWRGVGVSPGIATGPARVILHADTAERLLPGEILVAPFTDPGWSPYFLPAAGLVVDMGGLLSHGSIVAREYGIPAVVNVGPATQSIRTGQLLRVDGGRGTVEVLDPPP